MTVVAVRRRCDASPVFEPAPESFDEVAGAVGLLVVGDGCASAGGGRDDGQGASGFDEGADGVGVIAFVGDQPVEPACRFDQCGRHGHVVDIAGRDQKDARPAQYFRCVPELAGSTSTM